MSRRLTLVLGLLIVGAVGLWQLTDGGRASTGPVIVGLLAAIATFAVRTWWSRRRSAAG